MRAILVAVDYTDLLSITLSYNRHHFDDVMVVTDHHGYDELLPLVRQHVATVYATDAFYDNGAFFNKWKALEEALDVFGRHGWLCVMDADVLWPKEIPAEIKWHKRIGNLYTPRRRMWDEWPAVPHMLAGAAAYWSEKAEALIPVEKEWSRFPLHRQDKEFAGYSQIFHADDPALGPPPWHQTNWIHAGGADSFFQAKWSEAKKVRPPFEVLHLGPAGVNWFGRSAKYADGSAHGQAVGRYQQCMEIWQKRRDLRRVGLDPFSLEKTGQL